MNTPRRDPFRKLRSQKFILSSLGRMAGRRSWRVFRNYFLSGLLILLPSVVTIYMLVKIFQFADTGPLGKMMAQILGVRIPGIGLFLTIGVVMFSGLIARNVIGRKAFEIIESVLGKLPVARHVLSSIRQLSELFITGKKLVLERPVLVEYPRKGVFALGFITADAPECMSAAVGKKLVSVYVPTTPNPTSGLIIALTEEEVMDIGFSVDDAMKWIMSAGIILPETQKGQLHIGPEEGYKLADRTGRNWS